MSSVLQSPRGQASELLGFCNYQVSGDLKSSNEGAQLYLLTGANRKSVPGDNKPKLSIKRPGPAYKGENVGATIACYGGTGVDRPTLVSTAVCVLQLSYPNIHLVEAAEAR